MGRPPKPEEERLSEVLTIRMTESERLDLAYAAAARSLSVSQYVRQLARYEHHDCIPRRDLAMWLKESVYAPTNALQARVEGLIRYLARK